MDKVKLEICGSYPGAMPWYEWTEIRDGEGETEVYARRKAELEAQYGDGPYSVQEA